MGEKPNQRIALTKQLVHSAFLTLLRRKNIRQISIRELCAEAGINRTTFYNHYGSQYDVLAEITDGFLARIAAVIEYADVGNRESVHSRVTLILRFIQENPELSAMLINNSIDETFAERLFSLPKIDEMLSSALKDIRDERDKAAAMTFAIHGSYRVLQNWINDPERADAAEEAGRILGLARKVLS
ncbi:MAG: TetR/AcrR family transcriptional regulator [Eubacteriales bacterium]